MPLLQRATCSKKGLATCANCSVDHDGSQACMKHFSRTGQTDAAAAGRPAAAVARSRRNPNTLYAHMLLMGNCTPLTVGYEQSWMMSGS